MNKKLFFAAIIVFASLASSCKRESKLIIGSWNPDSDECSNAIITFNDDNTYTVIDPCEPENSIGGNYTVDKDRLTITPDVFLIRITYTIEDIDKSSMTLKYGGSLEKFTKVN